MKKPSAKLCQSAFRGSQKSRKGRDSGTRYVPWDCEHFGIVRGDVPKSEGCQARSSRTTGPRSGNDSVTALATLVRRDFVLVLHRISVITPTRFTPLTTQHAGSRSPEHGVRLA